MVANRHLFIAFRLFSHLLLFAGSFGIVNAAKGLETQFPQFSHQHSLLFLRDGELVVNDHLHKSSLIAEFVELPLHVGQLPLLVAVSDDSVAGPKILKT
jgi:hypothetical protein